MKKIALSLFTVLLFGNSAFAQFKLPTKTLLNTNRLERMIVTPSTLNTIRAWVPSRFVVQEHINLNTVVLPRHDTPVSASLAKKAGDNPSLAKMYALATQFVSGAYGEPGYGKAFYETQAQLARDLDAFYQGQAEVYVGPDGREVKLYALPVDGILYQPVGYKKPVVLNSSEYFVVYDVAAKTGKIVDNRPEIYNLFQARVYDEIWRTMGQSKVFAELSNLCETILMSHLHKAHIDQLRAQQVTNNIKTLVHQNESKVWKQVNSTQQLLQFLQHYPKVRKLSYGFTAYVIELPVEGLTWVEQNGTTHVYNPQEHVMLFFEMGSVGIYPRETIENKELFENI